VERCAVSLQEINFDGIVGPTHNYAGLSLGNLAATRNAGKLSRPRAAALEGLAKMRANLAEGLAQGFFVPLDRPDASWQRELAADAATDPALLAGAWSASAMWAANAATVSPAPDTADGRCHLTAANLVTMPHRAHEWGGTLAQLRIAFADEAHFAVHPPVPPCFGDEGAANHMRLAPAHDAPGAEVFVYGASGGKFPARQHEQASRIIARRHGLAPDKVLFIEQSARAIAAGAFHNDVVAVANQNVLFAHQHAFADPAAAHAAMRAASPGLHIIEVPDEAVSLAEAVRSYLFNAQLVAPPSGTLGPSGPSGEQTLVIPGESWESTPVRAWLEAMLAGDGPIRRVRVADVRQSMANGGGPACLRLRVVADPAKVDPRFMLDEAKAETIAQVIGQYWPETIEPAQLASPQLAHQAQQARRELLGALGLSQLT